MPLFFAFTQITLLLDNIFFFKYRRIKIEKPIFIIGNPRSGTTFIHNLLVQKGYYTAFETWHILFPSLTARFLLAPLKKYLIKKKHTQIIPDEIGHGVYIDKIEEEELLFMHILDTQFVLQLSPLAFDSVEHSFIRFHDKQPISHRKDSVKFFRSCLKRQIYHTQKKQIIAQIHFSVNRIKTILEIFPDAKFIYMIRSPYETIPSHLSLTHNLFHYQWSLKKIGPHKIQSYYKRRYNYDVELYQYFYHLQKNQDLSQKQVLILPYKQLRPNLYDVFKKITVFADLKITDDLRKAVKHHAQIQKDYKRKHKVIHLEKFGLTKDKIKKDLSFIFKQYHF